MLARADDVLDFWFGASGGEGLPPEAVRRRWFRGGAAVDAEIRARFGATVEAALDGGLADWPTDARGTLARVLVLDQLPRNVHRDRPRAFAGDARALALAREAVDSGTDRALRPVERYFLYLPFEHAEDASCQRRAVALFSALRDAAAPAERAFFEEGVAWAERHRRTIDRFGRFPGRNHALGRASTPEEEAFLREHPAGF